MSFWDILKGIFGGGGQHGATPPYAGGTIPGVGTTPAQQPAQSGFQQALPSIIGGAALLGSAALQNNSRNQANQAVTAQQAILNKMAQDEQARREYYSSILMPNILRGMGQSNPQVLAMAMQHLKALPGYGQAQGTTQPTLPAQGPWPAAQGPEPVDPNNLGSNRNNPNNNPNNLD